MIKLHAALNLSWCATFKQQIIYCAHVCECVLKSSLPPVVRKGTRLFVPFASRKRLTQQTRSNAEITCSAASLCAAITSCSIKVLHQVLLITKSLTVATEHSQMDVLGLLERKVITSVRKYCCVHLVTPYAENNHFVTRWCVWVW